MKKLIVHYKGSKPRISIHIPVGCGYTSRIGVVHFQPFGEMNETDALKLVELDSNFSIVESAEESELPLVKARAAKKKKVAVNDDH
jgi:hypothetical protein